MAIIKLTPDTKRRDKKHKTYNYSNEDAREKLINYIFDEEKTPNHAYGFRHLPNNPDAIPEAMKGICNIYSQEKEGKRKAEHFILSLTKEESKILGIDGLSNIVEKYIDFFADDYQVAYAIHENKLTKLHAHIIINAVSFRTGNRLHKNASFPYQQKELVAKLCEQEMNQRKQASY